MDTKCEKIYKYLSNLSENPKCELEYNSIYELLVAVILSAQCTDKRVNEVTRELFKNYNTPQKMLTLSHEELEQKIYSCGFYKNKAKSILSASYDIVEIYGGNMPNNFEKLTKIHGVGRKTANVVLSEGFKQDALAVDTHVYRVSHRLGLSFGKTPENVERDLKSLFDKGLWSKLHILMVLFGRYYCKSQNPKCENCELKNCCDFYKNLKK